MLVFSYWPLIMANTGVGLMSDTLTSASVIQKSDNQIDYAMESLGTLISSGWFVQDEDKIGRIADAMADRPEILCCAVLNEEHHVVGKIEREAFFSKLSRSFGRDVYAKRAIRELMSLPKTFFHEIPISQVTHALAQDMKNPQLQHFMVTDEHESFVGIFSTADLLVFLKNKVDDQAQEIAAKNAEILNIARSIQTSLLPKDLEVKDFEILPFMKTAEEIGGDYYDILRKEGKEWFLIGDVSGHGVPAGLVMMMTQTALHSVIHLHPQFNPGQIMAEVNQIITKNLRTMGMNKYMTGTLFHNDGGGILTYAGMHQDLLIYRYAQKTVETVETNGSWIGYADLMNEFPTNTVSLNPGDILFLFTDGITEAKLNDGSQFDLTGLVKFLEKYGHEGCEKLKEKILESFEQLEIDDDLTFVIIKKI